jgi:hypothetical protein
MLLLLFQSAPSASVTSSGSASLAGVQASGASALRFSGAASGALSTLTLAGSGGLRFITAGAASFSTLTLAGVSSTPEIVQPPQGGAHAAFVIPLVRRHRAREKQRPRKAHAEPLQEPAPRESFQSAGNAALSPMRTRGQSALRIVSTGRAAFRRARCEADGWMDASEIEEELQSLLMLI